MVYIRSLGCKLVFKGYPRKHEHWSITKNDDSAVKKLEQCFL